MESPAAPPDRVDWRIVIIVALLAMAMTTGALLAILQPGAVFSRERTATPAATSGTSAEHDAQAVTTPEPSPSQVSPEPQARMALQPRSSALPRAEESTSPAQQAESSCPDEVGCLLADKPPSCCSKYTIKKDDAGSLSPAQQSAPTCLDEVHCLLADKPPPCCSKYSGGQAQTGAPAMAPEKLTRSEITAGVNKMRARITGCSSKGSGEVKVTVRVAADSGLVDQVSLKSAPNAALGACVVDAMKHAAFARGKETTVFIYPFVF